MQHFSDRCNKRQFGQFKAVVPNVGGDFAPRESEQSLGIFWVVTTGRERLGCRDGEAATWPQSL